MDTLAVIDEVEGWPKCSTSADQSYIVQTAALDLGCRDFHRLRLKASVTLIALLLAPSVLFAAADLGTGSVQARRASSGVRYFIPLLAADLEIQSKTIEDSKLLIVVYYTDNQKYAEELAAALAGEPAKPVKVRSLGVVVETTNDPTFSRYKGRVPAGIFLAQSPNQTTLRTIIRYGVDHRTIIYSPFEGHVETGVLGGLSVEAQVRPYVNLSTLEASRISLKSIFLKIAKVYP